MTEPDLSPLRRQLAALEEQAELERQIIAAQEERRERFEPWIRQFHEAWGETFVRDVPYPATADLLRFLSGLGLDELLRFLHVATEKAGHGPDGARYFFGCCWRALDDLKDGG